VDLPINSPSHQPQDCTNACDCQAVVKGIESATHANEWILEIIARDCRRHYGSEPRHGMLRVHEALGDNTRCVLVKRLRRSRHQRSTRPQCDGEQPFSWGAPEVQYRITPDRGPRTHRSNDCRRMHSSRKKELRDIRTLSASLPPVEAGWIQGCWCNMRQTHDDWDHTPRAMEPRSL